MSASAAWHGRPDEGSALLSAVARHCTCRFNELTGDVVEVCAPHVMLDTDQRALDGLLFARRIVARLRREEWHVAALTRRIV
jgi:hypothetical protein